MAACTNCGRELSPAALVCPTCGAPGPAAQSPVLTKTGTGNTEPFAIASLITAILGFFMLPLAGSILGIVLGHLARRRIAERPELQGGEMATAGIIIGWIGLVLAIIAFLLFFVFLDAIFHIWS